MAITMLALGALSVSPALAFWFCAFDRYRRRHAEFGPDHDEFGSNRSKFMNVIEPKLLALDAGGRQVSIFTRPLQNFRRYTSTGIRHLRQTSGAAPSLFAINSHAEPVVRT